ncbi:LapA family protein [Pseudomonas panipatensis]|uniref:Uncharacterized integral membrane protein n=1 Tax=Pseudomonas panipatensis TaxID=428992 RepID=A0A1G8C6V6_9PSED|nr:LapA family protein [Pseudomonas panipatensis]SDH41277.1 Uncharacterized integral membrane protein [Pseudomonas panipatensis]SMP66089.1 Uncharacterized integral membrane protein [Pseudomonas panipatensis]
MLRVRRFLVFLTAILLCAMVIVFVLENLQTTHLAFLGWQTPEWPVVVFVTLAFVFGGLIGLLLSVPSRARTRVRMSGLHAEVSRFRKENEALRDSSLKTQ